MQRHAAIVAELAQGDPHPVPRALRPSKSATVLTGPCRLPAGGAERWRMRRQLRLSPTLRDAGNGRGMCSGLSDGHQLLGAHWGQAMRTPCSGLDRRPSGSGRR